jgi:hypothetical protein
VRSFAAGEIMSQFARKISIAMAASLAVVFLSASLAQAQTPCKDTRALTVKKRPFTDMGNVVPVGSQNHYATDGVQARRVVPTYYSNRGLYGNETLPGPFGARWN